MSLRQPGRTVISVLAAAVVISTPLEVFATEPPETLVGRQFLTYSGGQWKLAWHDEFDGTSLDQSKWSIGLPWNGDDGTNRHHNSQYASAITNENVVRP